MGMLAVTFTPADSVEQPSFRATTAYKPDVAGLSVGPVSVYCVRLLRRQVYVTPSMGLATESDTDPWQVGELVCRTLGVFRSITVRLTASVVNSQDVPLRTRS